MEYKNKAEDRVVTSSESVKDYIFFGVKVTASFRFRAEILFDLKSMDTAQLQRQMLIVKNIQVCKSLQ